MQRIDGANVAGNKPAYAVTNAPGYFTKGDPAQAILPTRITQDWLNAIQEELVAVATMAGASLDKANDQQLKTALSPVLALRSSASGNIGLQSTPHLRAQLAAGGITGNTIQNGAGPSAHVASDGCDLTGLSSACVAADDSSAKGSLDSIVAGSRFGFAWGSQSAVIAAYCGKVSGDRSIMLGGGNGSGTNQLVSGSGSALIASTDSSGPHNDPCTVAGDNAAVIASDRCDVGAGGDVSAILASYICDTQAGQSAILASSHASAGGSSSLIAASSDDGAGVHSITAGQIGAVIASLGGQAISVAGKAAVVASEDSQASGESSIVLASEGVEVGGNYCVGGGRTAAALGASTGNNRNNTWRIESITGNIYSDGVVGAGAADYAETFELATPGSPLPVGALVARTGRKARLAVAGDNVLGVVSAAPAIVGNAAPLEWRGRYERDEFGAFVVESVACIKWPSAVEARVRIPSPAAVAVQWIDDAGVVHASTLDKLTAIPAGARYSIDPVADAAEAPAFDGPAAEAPASPVAVAYKAQTRAAYNGRVEVAPLPLPGDAIRYVIEQRVETGAHDPSRPYASRLERPDDWAIVGLLGQLAVRVDASVAVDDVVTPSAVAGVGTKGKESTLSPRSRVVEALEILSPFDKVRGYGIALCLVR